MKSLGRFWRRLKANFEVSLGVMLTYRENVAYFLVFETLFLLAQFLTIQVGFDVAGGGISGWTRDEAFVLTAINGVSHQVFICFFISGIFGLTQTVWDGTFDYVMLKPIPPLAGALMYGQMIVSNFPGLLITIGLMMYLIGKVWGSLTGAAVVICALTALIGVFVRVGLALVVVTPVFFSERLAQGETSFWSLVRLASYPLDMYWRPIERLLTFVIPLATRAWIPSGALFAKELSVGILWPTVFGAVFVVVSYVVFAWGVRNYKSVNSGV